jgi:hypothetical protein
MAVSSRIMRLKSEVRKRYGSGAMLSVVQLQCGSYFIAYVQSLSH